MDRQSLWGRESKCTENSRWERTRLPNSRSLGSRAWLGWGRKGQQGPWHAGICLSQQAEGSQQKRKKREWHILAGACSPFMLFYKSQWVWNSFWLYTTLGKQPHGSCNHKHYLRYLGYMISPSKKPHIPLEQDFYLLHFIFMLSSKGSRMYRKLSRCRLNK